MNNKINVVFTIDKNYVPHFATALTSLLETNQHLVGRIFLVHDLDEESDLAILREYFKKKYEILLECVTLDSSILDDFKVTHHISKATYFRLLLDRILPDNVDAVLFLDSDIIVRGSLDELLDAHFVPAELSNDEHDDIYAYAVNHRYELSELIRLDVAGFKSSRYFNAGVMLINLKKWRERELSTLSMAAASRFHDLLLWWDQDVLNLILEEKWKELDFKYNAFNLNSLYSEDLIIIHYTGSSKPWHLNNHHPYKKLYWKYRNMTPYKSFLPDDFTLINVARWIKHAPIWKAFKS